MKESYKEGWGLPNMSRKWHYFINTLSLCRKYGFYGGYLEQGNNESPDNCLACRKMKKTRDRSG